jgi:hypothetical protein
LSGPRQPALITSDETPDVRIVIMPRVVPDAPAGAGRAGVPHRPLTA